MIESGQISEKDPVQNTVAKGTQGYNKKIYEVQAHAQNRGKSQRTMRKRARKKKIEPLSTKNQKERVKRLHH